MSASCEHLTGLGPGDFPPPDPSDACEDCLREGTRWVALRECQACGHVGCCDSSPGTHATRHYQQTGHPVVRSIMPGDTWDWCYLDEVTGRLA